MKRWKTSRSPRSLAASALVLLCWVAVAAADTATTRARSFAPAGLARVSDYLRNEIATGQIPGAVLLIQQHGRPVLSEKFGVRDVATQLPMSDDTIFRLYSMTKPVTSVAIMMLMEEGRLGLDDPVARYIPEVANMKVGVERRQADGKPSLDLQPQRRPMTIRDLLRHTSGIPYGFFGDSLVNQLYAEADLFNADLTNAEFTERLVRLPLNEQPGTRWIYGHSTDLLGRVVEVVSGQSLYDFERQRIFDPLGMTDTAYFVADAAKRPRIAQPMPGDDAISTTTKLRDPLLPRVSQSGGAGLVGTISDYARFAQMLLNGGTLDGRRYLKPETVALMTRDHVGPETGIQRDGAYYPGPTSGFGLGFAVRTSVPPNTQWPLGEYRWDGVAGTLYFSDPEDDMFVICMIQTPSQRGRIQLQLKTLIYQAMGR